MYERNGLTWDTLPHSVSEVIEILTENLSRQDVFILCRANRAARQYIYNTLRWTLINEYMLLKGNNKLMDDLTNYEEDDPCKAIINAMLNQLCGYGYECHTIIYKP